MLDFGAACDGNTDDQAAIRAAAACASTSGSVCTGGPSTTHGDGLIVLPPNRGCLFSHGTVNVGNANKAHVVLQGSPLVAPGANASLTGATIGSTMIMGPNATVNLFGNTGVSSVGLVYAGLYDINVTLTALSGTTATVSPALGYSSAVPVPVSAGGSGCVPADTTATFASGSNNLTLSNAISCGTSTMLTLGFLPAQDITQQKQLLASFTQGNTPMITLSGNPDITVSDVVMIGNRTCIGAQGADNPRIFVDNAYLDCGNGVDLGPTTDEGELRNVHMTNFLNAANVSGGPLASSLVGSFVKTADGSISVITQSLLDPGITAGDVVIVYGAAADPNTNGGTSTLQGFDGKFKVRSTSVADTLETLVLAGLDASTNTNLVLQPFTSPTWPVSGSNTITSSSSPSFTAGATIAYDNAVQGTGLSYIGDTVTPSHGSSGLHVNNFTSGGWTIAAYFANADHIYGNSDQRTSRPHPRSKSPV